MPFKRYAIGKVFRDGPIKLGRTREFYQCDADVVGSKSMLADAECIKIGVAGFNELEIPATISVNNRKLLEEILKKNGVKEEQLTDAMLTLDKIKKVGLDEVKKELKEKGIPESSVDFVVELSTSTKTNQEKIEAVKEFLGETEGFKELAELFSYLEGVENVIYDPALARGLAYYTSTVYEGFATDSNVTSSLCGGGRYDSMIGKLLGSKLEFPAVGFSFGLEPITAVLKSEKQLLRSRASPSTSSRSRMRRSACRFSIRCAQQVSEQILISMARPSRKISTMRTATGFLSS
jgi:histidyl-tRNA synthetase